LQISAHLFSSLSVQWKQEPFVSAACRVLAIAIALYFFWFAPPPVRAQTSVADQTLLNAANHDRAAAGLPSLHWDAALAAAAHQHALKMARMNQLSHQFPGEPSLQDRGRKAGARFSMIAENVAQGPTVMGLHSQWMNSPPHRANLLDPGLNAVGISVVQSGNTLFAVQDFATTVPSLTLDDQEKEVAEQLSGRNLQVVTGQPDARKTCAMDNGWSGTRPIAVLRYEISDLSKLPDEVLLKANSGKFHSASIGACKDANSSEFARFRLAILFF
jgi:uncharacterized protein YkwD